MVTVDAFRVSWRPSWPCWQCQHGVCGAAGHSKGGFTTLDYYRRQQRRACRPDSRMGGGNLFMTRSPDGVFVSEDRIPMWGRAKLALLAHGAAGATMKKGATNDHFMTSVAINRKQQVRSPRSLFRSAKIGARRREAVARPTDMGQYWDELVKTQDGWRIAKRTFHRVFDVVVIDVNRVKGRYDSLNRRC